MFTQIVLNQENKVQVLLWDLNKEWIDEGLSQSVSNGILFSLSVILNKVSRSSIGRSNCLMNPLISMYIYRH
jgi:hypothetical protein